MQSRLEGLSAELLITILTAAVGPEQEQQQQYLLGTLSLVCKRFHELIYSSCSSIAVPLSAAKQPPALFTSWLSRHGACMQELVIPAELLAGVAAQQPAVLPSLSNLRSLQLTGSSSALGVSPKLCHIFDGNVPSDSAHISHVAWSV